MTPNLADIAASFVRADIAFKASVKSLRDALSDTDAACPIHIMVESGDKPEIFETCSSCGGTGTSPYGGVCSCDPGGQVQVPLPLRHDRCFRVYDYEDWCEGCRVTQGFANARREASAVRGAALRRLLYWGNPERKSK